MKKVVVKIFLIGLLFSGCFIRDAVASHPIAEKLAYYSNYSKRHLWNAFQKAHIDYPPKQLALLVFKQNKKLQLYAEDSHSRWNLIKTFSIKAASGGPGPKLHQGDRQVPEGIYHITELNPNSHYLLSMKLDYPNTFDREIANLTHHHDLGGDIFIHGKARSVGCIAIGDAGIEQLYPLVAAVGAEHVNVIIAPYDLRSQSVNYQTIHPRWLAALYHRIDLALSDFPLHKPL